MLLKVFAGEIEWEIVKFFDMMLGALHDPFGHGHMGITAENISERYQIDRSKQDEFALTSQKRAKEAIEKGLFKEQNYSNRN